MASKKRQRQRLTRAYANAYTDGNPYGGSGKPQNPNGAPMAPPPTQVSTPDMGQPGMADDMGDGRPPRDIQAVSVRCCACGAEGEVKLSVLAAQDEGKVLRCRKCGSFDLDLADTVTKTAASDDLIGTINAITTQVTDLYLRIHLAHWNVVGPDFAEYHALFEKIYEDVYDSIDAHAENVRKLGGTVSLGSLGGFGSDGSATHLTQDLAQRNAEVISSLQSAFDLANAANEQGVANYLAERIDAHQKWQWQLTASESVVASRKVRTALLKSAAPYDRCSECGAEQANWGGLCDRCRKGYEDEAEENERKSKSQHTAAAQRCDNCGHLVRGAVPNEQGWECPVCKQGSMQDVPERTANVLNLPPLPHYAPTTNEIMRTVNAVPLPIERRPPNQENEPANRLASLVAHIRNENPGLPMTVAVELAGKALG